MAGWRGTCGALNWVCMLYRWLVGVLVMIAVSRWPWWQLHAGCPRPACLFLSGPGTVSRQLLSPTLITPSCPPCCLATPSKTLHNTPSPVPQCGSQAWMATFQPAVGTGNPTITIQFPMDTSQFLVVTNNTHQSKCTPKIFHHLTITAPLFQHMQVCILMGGGHSGVTCDSENLRTHAHKCRHG